MIEVTRESCSQWKYLERKSHRQINQLKGESRRHLDWLGSESHKQSDWLESELIAITEELSKPDNNSLAHVVLELTPQPEVIAVIADSCMTTSTPVNTGNEH